MMAPSKAATPEATTSMPMPSPAMIAIFYV
jgi:hypothetical protein